jgi:hypothetical protein
LNKPIRNQQAGWRHEITTRLIKTTILRGILFLVPIVIFVAIIGKALKLSNLIAAPLAER